MNPDAPQTPREALEIRITAMLMGELSAEESVALQKQIEGDLELADLAARLRQAMELLREASAIPEQPAPPVPAQLSSERRERLLAHFKAPAPAPSPVLAKRRRDWKPLVPLSLAASLIALLGGAVFLNGFAQRKASRSAQMRSLEDLVMVDSAVDQFSIERGKNSSRDIPLAAAESRWESQPGAIRTFRKSDANGRDNGTTPNGSPSSHQSHENPIIGRTALWSDDEASRVNINTAAEGTFWDKPATPRGGTDTATKGVPAEMAGRIGGTARPALAPIYLGQRLETEVAENAPAPTMDLFAIVPVVPGVSEPFSTAGKVNLSQPIEGFAYSAAGKTVLPQSITGVQKMPAPSGDFDRGLSKNMDGAFGDQADGGNVSFSYAGDTKAQTPPQPRPTSGGIELPALAFTDPAPAPVTAGQTLYFAEAKPAPGAPPPPAKANLGFASSWFESNLNGYADLNEAKAAPASGPAPAAPPLPEILAQSDFLAGGTAGARGFGGGLGRTQVAPEAKGKAANEELAANRLILSGAGALGGEGRKSGIADQPAGAMPERTADFGAIAATRGGIVAGKKARSQDWSGQVTPNDEDQLTRGRSTLGLERSPSAERENVELALGEKIVTATGVLAPGVEAGRTLALGAAQPVRGEYFRYPGHEATSPLETKLARPAKPGSVEGKPEVETRRLYTAVDELKFKEPELRQQVKALSDVDRLADMPDDFAAIPEPEMGNSLKEVRDLNTVAGDRLETAKPDDVKKKITEADGFYDSGRYDLAFKRAEQILTADPSNIEARKMQEKINFQRDNFANTSFDEARSRAIWETDAAGANPVRRFKVGDPLAGSNLDKGLDQLRDGVEKQRKRANEAAVEMAKIRERDGIVDPNPTDFGVQIGDTDRNIGSIETQVNDTRKDVAKLKGQMAEISKMKPSDVAAALRTLDVQDSTVENLIRSGDTKQMEDQLKIVRGNLDARIKFQEKVLGELEKNVEDAENAQIADKVKANEYTDAKTRFLQAKRIYEAAQTKLSTELGEKGKPVEVAKLEELKAQVAVKESDEKPAAPKPAEPAPTPQPEIATSANAFSTFSLNVTDVAFKLAAASLEKGQMPEVATVRSEEFINAFDYRDPEPAAGAPLAFAAERARYPFAQNRDLLRLSVKTAAAGRQPGRALNLVLLLDNSGSMERADRVRILREALRVLAAQLQPQDKLSVVTFARTPRLWADGVAGDKAGEVTARVGEITPQGGTNLSAALDLGYATARKHFHTGGINRVVLLTDGAANLGDVNPDALKQKVEAQRKQGVALDCFGIGWEGYDDTLLEALSRNGDGRYGFINTPEAAATEFAGQLAGALRVAASDVKVQVEWNPRRVTSYRQIGYAKHQLKKEQFRDNTVDAAEIGAAESGNALYVCEVNPRGEGDLATVRVRFKVPGTSDYREHEWTVPFTREAAPLEQASPALRLAGTASALSEWLTASQYASEVTPDRLLGLLNGVPATFGADPRPGKLEWMIRTAKSVSGK